MESWIIILVHLIIFQGMFITKNITLGRKIKKKIRGKNIEATISIIYYSLIIAALSLSVFNLSFGKLQLTQDSTATIAGIALLIFSLIISAATLVDLGDSWRVGVLGDQATELVTSGIYRLTRNPYFISYLLMFVGYTVILQNLLLLSLTVIAIFFVHFMILKEEKYLFTVHPKKFSEYKNNVPRYLFIQLLAG